MNIFATYDCPIMSAQALDDKRVVKMIVESAQMMSMAVLRHEPQVLGLYKPVKSWQKHTCTVWAGNNRENFMWLYDHALELCKIYSAVYHRRHESRAILNKAASYHKSIPRGSREPFATAFTLTPRYLEYLSAEPCEAYRMYLSDKWRTDKRKPTWTHRPEPEWREN